MNKKNPRVVRGPNEKKNTPKGETDRRERNINEQPEG